MRPPWTIFGAWVLGLAMAGCRTPVLPPTVPVANLYPTLNPSSILETSRSVSVTAAEVSAILTEVGLLEPLTGHGMGPGEVPLVCRGLQRHGYAELDGRRSGGPVRWVVLRGVAEGGATCLVVEAGLESPPARAAQWGIEVRQSSGARTTRADIYGRRAEVETWRGTSARARVEVSRVQTKDRRTYWEVDYRVPAAAAPAQP